MANSILFHWRTCKCKLSKDGALLFFILVKQRSTILQYYKYTNFASFIKVLEESHSNDNKNANISLKILKKNFRSNIIKNSRLIFQYRDACSSHDKNCQKQLSIVVAQNSSSKNVIKFTVKYRGVLSLVKFLVRICIFFKNSTPSQMFLRNFSEELFYRILPDESF